MNVSGNNPTILTVVCQNCEKVAKVNLNAYTEWEDTTLYNLDHDFTDWEIWLCKDCKKMLEDEDGVECLIKKLRCEE